MLGRDGRLLGCPGSERETIELGVSLGHDLVKDQSVVIALVGQLGAGKTHFSKGIVQALGGDPIAVTSPTFSLVNEYRDTSPTVCHFDFYRLEEPQELLEIGWEEYVYDRMAIVIVEWADRFPELLPEETRWFEFTIEPDQSRRIIERSSC